MLIVLSTSVVTHLLIFFNSFQVFFVNCHFYTFLKYTFDCYKSC